MPWGYGGPTNQTPFTTINVPYPNVCYWNRNYLGQNYLACQVRGPTPSPTVCAALFSANRDVPVGCCSVYGIGCTPGRNAPLMYQGMRNY